MACIVPLLVKFWSVQALLPAKSGRNDYYDLHPGCLIRRERKCVAAVIATVKFWISVLSSRSFLVSSSNASTDQVTAMITSHLFIPCTVHPYVSSQIKFLNTSFLTKYINLTHPGSRVLPGRVYKFQGWTKLLDRKKTGDIHSLELWIRYKKRGDKAQRNKRLARRTKYSQGWLTDDRS